ncbi:MAG: NADP-dependent isocitrate dehydrogenase, partial [Pseudomonadota bacterium]
MTDQTPLDIVYTTVDEAPELASASLLPIIQKFAAAADVRVGRKDISLAGRILAVFADHLTDAQKQNNDLALLGDLVKTPAANVIKLPNISASVPQLVAAIAELQGQGFAIPDYPETPETDAEKDIRARYDTIKGSAVNPVLREGNSDRRAAKAVKAFAQANPHRMGAWGADSKTRVASMPGHDFFANETSATLDAAATAKIVHIATDGTETVLKDGVTYPAGTVVDATFMSVKALSAFLAAEIEQTPSKRRAKKSKGNKKWKENLRSCGEPCPPCAEECAWACPHHRCEVLEEGEEKPRQRLCQEICERPRCSRPCGKMIKCPKTKGCFFLCRGVC